ncbi:phage protein NinX family protein [Morganella morganii]|uniref:phage protein NinX family protein n=1 Tax=Morganella morganii TaxID=582 RepID=UPI0030CBFFFD|nr:DUF2591 family protein [Morganella morganii]
MNKYRDKSDFEINKAVAIQLDNDGKITSWAAVNGIMVGIAGEDYAKKFDPCNDPADTFPLIIDMKLSIHPDFYNNCESWIVRTVHIPPVKDKSLTRAICIAYLMMKDAENEKV